MSFKENLKVEDVVGLRKEITIASESVPIGRGINARLHLYMEVEVLTGASLYRLEFGKDKWDLLTLADAIDEYNVLRKTPKEK